MTPKQFLTWASLAISLTQGCCKLGHAEEKVAWISGAARVIDGDSLYIGSEKIRMSDIDAPEMKQDGGPEAKAFLEKLCGGKQVQARVIRKDRYGRWIAHVKLVNGPWLDDQMIKAGMAWRYDAYSKDPELGDLQAQAKADKRGLWKKGDAIPPWEFRKQERGRK